MSDAIEPDWTAPPVNPDAAPRRVSRRGTPLLPGRAAADVSTVRVFRRTGGGTEVACGDLDIGDATEEQIIDQFIQVMPKPGDRPVTFRIVPVTIDGTELRTNERHWTVDEHHLHLARRRAANAERGEAGTGTGESKALLQVIGTLQDQLARLSNQVIELQSENVKVVKDAVAERERHMSLVHTDVSEGYRGVMEEHRNAIRTVQTDITSGYDRVLQIQKDSAEADRHRIKAEADAKVAIAKAEADAMITRIKAEGELERERLASRERIELANINAEKERIRLEAADRATAEQRRRTDEAAERDRREAKEREDQIRRDEMANQQFQLTREFFDKSSTQQMAHMETQLALVKAKSEGNDPIAGVTKLLASFGISTADAFGFIKGAFTGGGGGGWAEKLIEQVGGVGKELLKTARATARIQAGMEDTEEETEEDDEEPEQIAQDRPLPGPNAPAAIAAAPAAAASTAAPAVPAAPKARVSKLTKPVLRKVRDAMAGLVEALKAEPQEGKWAGLITPTIMACPEIIDWLREQSIEGALRDAQCEDEFIARLLGVLDASGLVPGDIPRRLQ